MKLAQLIINHTNDARSSKSPFQLTVVLGFVKNTAASTVVKDLKPNESPWDAVGRTITQLVEEGAKLLPSVLENENVIKSEFDEIASSRIIQLQLSLIRYLEQSQVHHLG